MPDWETEFRKKMAEYKPGDKWMLSRDQGNWPLPHGWYQYEQKHLFARFKCSNCNNSWKSAQGDILFHMRLGATSGQVKMRVFGQMCDRCKSPKYEEPPFRDDTVAFVLHNLVRRILKKCYREAREIPPLPAPVSEDLPEGPHKRENCEACQRGLCLQSGAPLSVAPSFRWEARPLEPSSFIRPSNQEANRESFGEMVPCLAVVAIFILVLLVFISTK